MSGLVVIGWGIFYFDNFSQMTVFFQRFFGQAETFHDFLTTSAITDNFWMWVLALLFCMPVRSTSARLLARITHEGSNLHQTLKFSVRLAVSLLMLILSVALLVGATNNAFIYTRF